MKGFNGEETNICLLFGCSMCCNPVKINSRRLIDPERDKLPFVKLEGVLVPKSNPDTVRLKQYRCSNFNVKTGLCTDYDNRPNICRNTTCRAFDVIRYIDKKRIVEQIKEEQFFSKKIINYSLRFPKKLFFLFTIMY